MVWAKVDDRLHSSAKWRAASKGARALWATALSWCADQETDGIVPSHMLAALDGTRGEARSLESVGLWEASGDGWAFKNWREYQPTREQLDEKRRIERERIATARANAKAKRDGVGTNTSPTHDGVGVRLNNPDPTRPNKEESNDSSSSEIADAIARPEIDYLLDILDGEIIRNGGKAPSRTKKNRDAVRLMLDRDKHTVDQIERAIRWCQADEFWRANILSASKLREKYETLRIAATRSKPGNVTPIQQPKRRQFGAGE